MNRRLVLALTALSTPAVLDAQGVGVGAARWLSSPHTTEFRLGIDGVASAWDAVSFRPNLQLLRRGGDSRGGWGGVGSDLIVRVTHNAQPYLIGGAGLGLGRPDSLGGLAPAMGLWGGLGAELFTLGPIGLQAEALYSWRARMSVNSISLGIRAGMKIGRGRGRERGSREPRLTTPEPVPSTPLPRAAPGDEETIRRATAGERLSPGAPAATTVAGSVVATALGAMGTPYRWGGEDGNGFDCSGLIQYAFAEHGVELPRRSSEQAHAGFEVGRDLLQLSPGDILTFTGDPSRSGDVTHVGLYLGEGRFIHSATGGVQVSVLSAEDSVGRWWYERWLGARRVADR